MRARMTCMPPLVGGSSSGWGLRRLRRLGRRTGLPAAREAHAPALAAAAAAAAAVVVVITVAVAPVSYVAKDNFDSATLTRGMPGTILT